MNNYFKDKKREGHPKEQVPEGYVTVPTYAKLIGIHHSTLYKRIKAGTLEVEYFNSIAYVKH